MRLRHALALLVAMLPAGAWSQAPAGLDPHDPPAVVQTSTDADDRLTIPIHIGGKGPYSFVVDTGSQRTVISRELADRLALPADRRVRIMSMTGPADVDTVKVPRLSFGATKMAEVQAPVLHGEHLGAAGLLGLDGLHRKRLVIDFRTGRMHIGASRHQPERHDPDTIVVQARSRLGQLILLDSRAEGQKVNIILDTGAEQSIGNAALLAKLTKKSGRARIVGRTSLTSVIGGELSGDIVILKRVSMGNLVMRNLPVVFAEASPFAQLGLSEKPSLLLGISALRGFDRVAIDFGRKKVDFLLPDQSAVEAVQLAALNP